MRFAGPVWKGDGSYDWHDGKKFRDPLLSLSDFEVKKRNTADEGPFVLELRDGREEVMV